MMLRHYPLVISFLQQTNTPTNTDLVLETLDIVISNPDVLLGVGVGHHLGRVPGLLQ
jgi:hypothetical protein